MNNLNKYLSQEEYEKLLNLELYDRCKLLVEILFDGKFDKNNKSYIEHLYRVSSNMSSEEGKILGLLHDVVEDIDDITFNDLKEFGISKDIINALILITNEKKVKEYTKEEKLDIYNKKIDKIIESGNMLVIELKLSDISDTYDEERIRLLSKDKQDWFKLKYGNNIKKLKKVYKGE